MSAPPVRPRQSQRRQRRSAARAGAVLLASSLLCASARCSLAADAPPAATEQQRKTSAQAKYEEGVQAYRNERYADAVRSFLEADALSPSAALSYNIARVYEKLADDAQTLRWYRNYLRLNPKASNAAEVQKYIATLAQSLAKKGIQQVTVLSVPTGATLAIDNHPLGITPLTVELSPGAHTTTLTLRGYLDAANQFSLPATAPLDLSVELQPAPIQASVPVQNRGRRFGVAPYITLGAGAVLLGIASIYEIQRRSAQSSAKQDVTQLDLERDLDAMNSRQRTARVFFGIGSAVALTGTALLVLNTRLSPTSRASISGLPGGGTLSLEHSF
ncbi:MAG: PEGA domain-containing protein [Pseudomonadota bacterium]